MKIPNRTGTARWQRLRRRVLARDGYRCRAVWACWAVWKWITSSRWGEGEGGDRVGHGQPAKRFVGAVISERLRAENRRELTPAELRWRELLAATLARR